MLIFITIVLTRFLIVLQRNVITTIDIPANGSGQLRVPIGTIVTPSARELADERGIAIIEVAEHELHGVAPPGKTVGIGSDHGGFETKERLKPILEELGFTVRDVGVYEEKAADYPDIAEKVADMVAQGLAAMGVLIDGAGIGSSMAANKVPGVRASLCWDKASARNAKEHNNANVLTLGGRLLTATQCEDVLRTWITTPFAGGRHQARVDKITAIEQKHRK